ncbi:MAG: hypothetical protein FWG70_07790 [Oscillospiraceae bacterium]|nr:hypothetical protein [Oscillospiraceae bacterium]
MKKAIKRVFAIAVSAIMIASFPFSAEGTVIFTPIPATSTRHLKSVSETERGASERLSSGYRINRATEDAAGLSKSEKIRNQIRGLEAASRFEADGISLIETSAGAMDEIKEMLERMRELVVTGMADTADTSDRAKISDELDQLAKEIESITEREKIPSLEELKRMS